MSEVVQDETSQTHEDGGSRTVLDDPAVQAEIERRVTAAVKKTESRVSEKAERERKALEEKALMEQGEWKKVAESKAAEAEEARRKLERMERGARVDELLNKRAADIPLLKEPSVRAAFHRIDAELPDLDKIAESLQSAFGAAVEAAVVQRLASKNPDKVPGGGGQSGSLMEQIRAAESKGDWATSWRLKNEMMAQTRS